MQALLQDRGKKSLWQDCVKSVTSRNSSLLGHMRQQNQGDTGFHIPVERAQKGSSPRHKGLGRDKGRPSDAQIIAMGSRQRMRGAIPGNVQQGEIDRSKKRSKASAQSRKNIADQGHKNTTRWGSDLFSWAIGSKAKRTLMRA